MRQKLPLSLTAERYERLTAPIRRRKWALNLLLWSNRICSMLFYIAYPLCILWMLYTGDYFTYRAILIPAISFALLTVVRQLINRPRPYERLSIKPLHSKRTRGKSFPSRHVFSAFIIAATMTFVFPWGWIFYLPAALLAVIRVLMGVHYPSDVMVGAGFALAAALFYYL
ncbi:MAG: phosphatase PAP2 family protein [Clostridia bacterium]|nr:phosphatase PAP2 family protein [Clostridia bacterium]